MSDDIYTIKIQSKFLLTSSEIKKKFGIGFKVLEVQRDKTSEYKLPEVYSVDTLAPLVIKYGYRELAKALHPDLGGADPEGMTQLNRTKQELLQILEELTDGNK